MSTIDQRGVRLELGRVVNIDQPDDDSNDEQELFVDEDRDLSSSEEEEEENVEERLQGYQHDHVDGVIPLIKVVSFGDAWRGDASWDLAWNHFLYPPNVPRECQLLRLENIAIPACYLLVGLLQGMSSVLTSVFPLDIGASEAQQTTLRALRVLPSSFKMVFGFISDSVPIYGYRRKPYMLMGWFLCSASQWSLLLFSNLQIDVSGSGCFKMDLVDPVVPTDAPTIPFLALSILLFAMGYWFAEVMGDSMVAVKAKQEPPHCRGSVQSSCYSYRYFGLMVSAPCAAYLYSATSPVVIVRILAALPLGILPLIYWLQEDHLDHHGAPSTRNQFQALWNTVCQRAVWQTLGATFLYNALQIGNAAWREFQRTVLHFTSCQLNLLGLVGYAMVYAGVVTYKYYLMQYSWKNIYILTTVANAMFGMMQILLIYGLTFGLPAFWFALGDDVFLDFIDGIQFLPNTIMLVQLVPEGSEGSTYALFTTNHNAALHLATTFSTLLLPIWDVSKATMAAGDLSGLANLAFLTKGLQLSAIVVAMLWIPHYKEDLLQLTRQRSSVGGFVFLSVTLLSVFYTIFVSLMNIVAPGWLGAS